MKIQFLSIVLFSILFISACAGKTPYIIQPDIALPTLPTYSEEFRNSFADEVDVICGHSGKGIPRQYPFSCVFIQDAIELRAAIRALQN